MEKNNVIVSFIGDEDVGRLISTLKDRADDKPGQRVLRRKNRDKTADQNVEDSEEDATEEEIHTIEKSAVLNDESDLPGHRMFGFHTPKRRTALLVQKTPQSTGIKNALLVQKTPQSTGIKNCYSPRTPKTPNTPRTPKSTKKPPQAALPPKTPYSFRRRLKEKIADAVRENGSSSESEPSDFSESESEYKPSGSEQESEEPESENEDEEEEEEPLAIRLRKRSKPIVLTTPRRTRRKDMEYVPAAEEFFASRSSKSVTSDHTLRRLEGPRLERDQLLKLMDDMSLSHRLASAVLYDDHTQLFGKWMFLLMEGFSVLLHGLGSKRSLIQQFSSEMLQDPDHLIVEVNGFFPSLTVKEILDCVADVLEMDSRPANMMECLGEIEEDLENNPDCHLFILIHNLDGPMLRSDKSQDIISKLVRINRVHLLASVDHVNAPLIWDHAKLSRYNFLWWDVTTFIPYMSETQFESSLLVQRSGQLALSSLSHVFNSLNSNARSVFLIMVSHQLANKHDSTYKGMYFRDLYWSAREALLVSSDLSLRAHLQEFIDHQLVRQRRSADGSEIYHIPIDASVLQHFKEETENKEE